MSSLGTGTANNNAVEVENQGGVQVVDTSEEQENKKNNSPNDDGDDEKNNNEHDAADLDPPRSCGERLRDWILRTLDRPFFQILGIAVLLLVMVDGALFFFLLVGWQNLCRPRTDCEPRNWWYNFSVHLLNVLFSYMATVSMPWRCTNFLHICGWGCPHRENAPGHDLYGRPVQDDVWFHVPLRKRLGITIVLLFNCLFQYANQVTRILFYSYELQHDFPGSLWVNIFFVSSFACAGAGGAWLGYEIGQLRKADPDHQFGPGPVDMLRSSYSKRFGNSTRTAESEDQASDGQGEIITKEKPQEEEGERHGVDEEEAAEEAVTPTSPQSKDDNDDPLACNSMSHVDPTREPRRRSLVPTSRSSMRMFAM